MCNTGRLHLLTSSCNDHLKLWWCQKITLQSRHAFASFTETLSQSCVHHYNQYMLSWPWPIFSLLPEQRDCLNKWSLPELLFYSMLPWKVLATSLEAQFHFPAAAFNWQNFNHFHTFHLCLPPKLLRAPSTLDKQWMLVHLFNVYSSFWVCLFFCNLFLSKECKHKH